MTIEQSFELAVQHHQSGRLAEAEALYRQILAADPRHAGALHLLGVVAHQVGQNDVAVELIRQATALKPDFPEAYNNLGIALKDQGQLDEAIAACRQAIILKPHYPAAYYNLGIALEGQNQLDEAIAAYRQAIALKPDHPNACNNLGNVLKDKGQLDEAIAVYRQAIALKPDYAEAHSNLGNALREKGQFEKAVTACREAISLQPNLSEAHSNLGNALREKGQLDEAIAAYRQAIALKPNRPEAYSNLGNALEGKGRLDEAIAACRQAIALKPSYPEAHSNLGVVLKTQGRLDEAIAAYRRAIALKPNYPEAHNNLGGALRDQGQLDEAIASYHHAIALNAHYSDAHSNLGVALKDVGQLDEAIAAYRQAIALKPSHSEAHSNLALTLHYHPGFDARAIARELELWNQQHVQPLRQFLRPHPNDATPDRRLRIGYVSPDFRGHPVGRSLLPLLAQHDHHNFEIFCYPQVPVPDDLTRQLRAHADHWHSLLGLTNPEAAELIRQHQIDILVDLALHTAHHRLLMFAHQPAPVQVSYAGYPGSAGVETIGYRISDRWLESEMGDGRSEFGSAPHSRSPISHLPSPREALLSDLRSPRPELRPAERVFLLDSFWCYSPHGADLPVNALPALENKFVTFGCLNNFCKVNEQVLALWSRILARAESSRLIILSFAGSHRQRTLARLQQAGVDASRVDFVAPRPRHEYLEFYHRIDIGLDTFPYNGHTTSLDAFWMGVPVIGLAGELPVSRAGLSNLMNLGLPELLADTEDEYVEKAAQLAADLPRLARLRATLRSRMEASPLMDAPRFARSIEAAYRAMWRRWCRDKNPALP